MKHLERVWRLCATTISFSIFGLGGLLITLVLSPLIFLLVRDPDRRQRVTRRLASRAFRIFIWIMKASGVLTCRISGLENARDVKNLLIIANHPTLIDVVFLVSLFPQADCVVKDAVFRNPFMLGVVMPARYISGGSPGHMINACVGRLESGGTLLLFPEGTRTVPGQPLKFKLGASSIAIQSGATFLPVIIRCSQPGFLAKNQPWYKVPKDRPDISIQIKPAVSVNAFVPADMSPRDKIRELNKALMVHFESELEKA